jgi:hypothetical protein
VAGQRERARVVARQHHVASRHPFGERLGGIGEQLASGTVAESLRVQLVGQRGEVHAQAGIHHLQHSKACRQVAGQTEFVADRNAGRQ